MVVDPSGLRPLTQEEFDQRTQNSDLGIFDKAWEAMQDDPWGSLALGLTIAAGVGLMFIPGGQVIGAGILISTAVSGGVGVATGNFDPRTTAVSGLIGGVSGGAGAALMNTSLATRVAAGAVIDGTGDVVVQKVQGGPINMTSVAASTATGGVIGGVAPRVRDAERTYDTIVRPKITVYRGTSFYSELDIWRSTGVLMSESAQRGFRETDTIAGALDISRLAHARAISLWDSEANYVQAHGVFGNEVKEVSGERSMMSVTTDPDIAKYFSGSTGSVFQMRVRKSQVLQQTWEDANESEFLVPHLVKAKEADFAD